MEIKIDLDFPSIIAHAVSAERIQPLVNKAIAEAVGAAIRDATDYSSPFRKALETRVCRILCKRPIHCRRKPACP